MDVQFLNIFIFYYEPKDSINHGKLKKAVVESLGGKDGYC